MQFSSSRIIELVKPNDSSVGSMEQMQLQFLDCTYSFQQEFHTFVQDMHMNLVMHIQMELLSFSAFYLLIVSVC